MILLARTSIQFTRCYIRTLLLTPSYETRSRPARCSKTRDFTADASLAASDDALDRLTKASQRARSPKDPGKHLDFFGITNSYNTISLPSQESTATWANEVIAPRQHELPSVADAAPARQKGRKSASIYAPAEQEMDKSNRFYTEDDVLLKFDYATHWSKALESESPDLCFRCILAAHRARDTVFFARMTSEDRSHVLNLMRPQTLFPQLLELHLGMQESMVEDLGIMSISEVVKEWSDAIVVLLGVFRIRRRGLSAADYETLFSGTKMLRLRYLAADLWKDMETNGVRPTIGCVNKYCASMIWERPLDAKTRHQDRNIALHMLLRRCRRLPECFSWRTIGKTSPRKITRAIHAQSAHQYGLGPNTESFCNMINAAAMEGDLAEVDSILHSVWRINVQKLRQAGEDVAPFQPAGFEQDTSIAPNEEMLFTLANAYCINDDLPTALKLVNYLSCTYEVPMTREVWAKLLEYAYVLGRHRPKYARVEGQVKLEMMEAIWRTMTSPPHNILMDFTLLDKVFRMFRQFHQSKMMLAIIDTAKQHLDDFREVCDVNHEALERDTFVSPGERIDEQRSRENELNWLQYKRDRSIAITWLHLYLEESDMFTRSDTYLRLSCVEIPNLLGRWLNHLPRQVQYHTTTGRVELTDFIDEEADGSYAVEKHVDLREKQLEEAARYIDKEWMVGKGPSTQQDLADHPLSEQDTFVTFEPVFKKPRPPPRLPLHKQEELSF